MHEIDGCYGAGSDIHVILVPGIGTPPAQDWDLFNHEWHSASHSLSATTDVSFFDHGIQADQKFNFERLIEAGSRLQDKIVKICEADKPEPKPLILLAHSLGGAILKQTLCILNARANQFQDYQHILNLIAGVVFIGCPHGIDVPELLKENCVFLFKQYAIEKLNNQTLAAIKDNVTTHLIGIGKRFSSMSFGFDILTIYELHPTTQKSLVRKKHKIIVDKTLALIHARHEKDVGLDADHSGICTLLDARGQPFAQVLEWLRALINAAPSIIEERLQTFDAQLSRTVTPSLRTQASVEVMRKAFARSSLDKPDESKVAHKGSPAVNEEMSTIFENFSPSQLVVNLPCFTVDNFARNNDFFGRKTTLMEIDQFLLPNPKAVSTSAEPGGLSIVALRGMPGLGKTEIALEYVFTRRDQFDAVFWLGADKEETLESGFCRIATALGLKEEGDQQNPVIIKEAVKDWLSTPRRVIDNTDDDDDMALSEASWLLVFDNADEPDLLHDYLQIYGRGSILITSRDPAVKECYPHIREIELGPFSDQDAAKFLQLLTKKPSTSEDDQLISQYLGGLPLAIAQMAGVIRKQLLTLSEFKERLEDPEERSELYALRMGTLRDKTARGDMSSIWAINQLDPPARKLLQVMAFLNPDRIPESLFNPVNPDTNKRSLILPMRKGEYHEARAQLIHSSIIRRNEKNELWIHRVPQHVVRSSVEEDKSLQAQVFSCAVNLIKSAWPSVAFEKRHAKSRSAICEGLFPHVITLKECYNESILEVDASAMYNLACVFQEAAWWLYERGNLTRSRPIALMALKICEKYIALDEPHWLDRLSLVYDVLGCVANGTNMPEDSMKFNTELLAIRKRITYKTEKEDFPLAYAHNQAGCAWMIAKEYTKGCELFTEALRIWHSMTDYKKGIASMEYANLGLSYWLQGDLKKASEVLEKGLQEREVGFGKNDIESFRPGRILHALGNVRASQGRFEESQDYHQRALKTYQAAVGSKYHRTADMCHKLAQHCVRSGDQESLENAKRLLDQALSIWKSNPGAHRPEIARSTFLKAKTLYLLKSDELSHMNEISLFEKAVAMFGQLKPGLANEAQDIAESDFDELITFWSR